MLFRRSSRRRARHADFGMKQIIIGRGGEEHHAHFGDYSAADGEMIEMGRLMGPSFAKQVSSRG